MQNVWFMAAAWMGLAFVASCRLYSHRSFGCAHLRLPPASLPATSSAFTPTEWINFLATFGAGLLTFLAGAEIDPESLRAHLKVSLTIGVISFLVPFLGAWGFAYWVSGWDYHGALIAGIALSTTSVAVVYAVMVETGLSSTDLGKLILAACFVTDFGTVLALGAFFADFNKWMLVFVAVLAVTLWYLPRWTRAVVSSFGQSRVSEPEVKFLFLVLFFLGGVATTAKSEAVLPAYLAGLVVAGVFLQDKVLVHRMRSIAFTMLTPFYFIKAGLYVSLPALATSAGLVIMLLCGKNGGQADRSLAARARLWTRQQRKQLYDAAHGDRSDLRHNLRALRLGESPDQSNAIHGAGDRGDPERSCADLDCAGILFAKPRGCAADSSATALCRAPVADNRRRI